VSDVLALIDLDGTLVDRDCGFALWARAFVAERDLGDGALTWLEQTGREVKKRGEFFANGWVDNQIGKLRRAGMEEVGIRKPDPAMFTLTRQRCGASDDPCCWVVGDDPRSTSLAARRAAWGPSGSAMDDRGRLSSTGPTGSGQHQRTLSPCSTPPNDFPQLR
jgi:hypothetical protein